MTEISAAERAARESARQDTGRFGKQEQSAPELALSTPAAPAPVPFVFDNDYRNTEQVRPFMGEYLRVYDSLTAAGAYPYNDSFKGRIPSLASASENDEDTAIYLLQTLRRLDEEAAKRSAFIESGGRKVTAYDLEPGQVLRGTVVRSGFYMGGTGWEAHENIRLRRHTYPNGRTVLAYVEKGKRTGHALVECDIYFRED